MKITKIAQQEKLKGRYSVFVDEKYAFSLSESALLDSGLASGQELTKEALKDWKKTSADDKLYGLALRYAATRLRSTWEMETYLKRKEAAPALTDKLLSKLSSIGLLDDAKFAQAWVATRRLLRPTSKRKLQQELRTKRITEDVIKQALLGGATDELAVLREVVAKKRQLARYKSDNLKLMQYLARQGFGYEDIKSTLEK